jgi:hypothetical protein|tara:strand:+ start:148 stop:312 length:165 start_codon:yes stop_codon:yes gene_type:complete
MNFCKKCGKPFEPKAGYKNYCSNVCKIKKPACRWNKDIEEYNSISKKIGEYLGL